MYAALKTKNEGAFNQKSQGNFIEQWQVVGGRCVIGKGPGVSLVSEIRIVLPKL